LKSPTDVLQPFANSVRPKGVEFLTLDSARK
jgi:hypothetical protein